MANLTTQASNGVFPISGCQFLPTGLVIEQGLTFDQWDRIGSILLQIEGGLQWWVGDWLRYGELNYGEHYAQAQALTGLRYGTVANLAYVAGRIEFSRRRENLSFSHHQEVAALDKAQQEKLLSRAEDEGLRRIEVRREAAVLRAEQQADSEGRLFDRKIESAKAEWQSLRPQLNEFGERYSQFKVLTDDYLEAVDEHFQLTTEDPLTMIVELVERQPFTFAELLKATGFGMATVERLVEKLVDDKRVQVVKQGGKTDAARGAQVDLIVPYNAPVGSNFRGSL